MSPAYAIKKGVRYRYYTSCLLAQGRKEEAGSVSRVSAMQIEQIVLEGLRQARGKSARHMTVATEVDIVAGVERVVVHPRTIDVEGAASFDCERPCGLTAEYAGDDFGESYFWSTGLGVGWTYGGAVHVLEQ